MSSTVELKDKIVLAGGAMTSSKIPRIEMIPYRALLRLAARFELGEERHKDASWNGMKPENAGLKDKNTMVVRAAHAMLHASKLIAILTGQIPDDGDDHASAVMWAGAFLCESDEMEVRKREKNESSSTSGMVKLTCSVCKQKAYINFGSQVPSGFHTCGGTWGI